MEENPLTPEDPPNYKEFDDEAIKSILKDALKMKLKETRKIPQKNELNNALIGMLGEFLACYRIIGYDLDGNPVNMTIYKEKIEKSALDNAFMEEVGKFMGNRI